MLRIIGKELHFSEFIAETESLVRQHVRSNYPHDWEEDHLTRSLLQAVRTRFKEVTITGFKEALSIRCEAYKYKLPEENDYGDVGIYIQIARREGPLLEGAAFLEAKRRAERKDTFEQIRNPQLRTIVKNAPHAMVLLYDYSDITGYSTNQVLTSSPFDYARSPGEGLARVSATNAVVTPANSVLALRNRDKGIKHTSVLYAGSLPFSHQLCFRYLHGFDLEYGEEQVEIARGYAERRKRTKFVMTLQVREEGAFVPEEFRLNRDMLEEL